MMIVLLLAILSVQFIYSSTTNDLSNNRYNSLISAQCKARCLYEYRNQHHHHHQQQRSVSNLGKSKRLLTNNLLTLPWRSIWERCPRLLTCSSCLLPCDLDPPLLLSSEQSCQAICSTLRNGECQRSCLFIQKLYAQQLNCLTDDCQSSSCSPLNDCFETILQPNNVTAIERKSRRTVKLKWNSEQSRNVEPIFYVIEAQWTLPKTDQDQQDTVSKWGFVKEEVSHTKAIIRNIQRDNRWYKFRVAAVTRQGYSKFSSTTEPFRLSSNSKNDTMKSILKLASPRNFSIKTVQFNVDSINLTLTWQPPPIPVSGYQISWESENARNVNVNSIDISNRFEQTIPFLSMQTSYMFKIRSLITSNVDFIQTSLPVSLKYHYEENLFSIENFRHSSPYFINGIIKMNISWNEIDDDRLQQYDLHWIESQCYSDVTSCCYRRDAVTTEHFFQLNDLRFNCTYVLYIKPIVSTIRIDRAFQISFNVTSCQSIEVIGTIRPPCQINEQNDNNLHLMVRRNQTGLIFSWLNPYAHFNDTADIVYQLRIEQLPNHDQLLSVDLSSTRTNYYLPYSHYQYLNITLILYHHWKIIQQQSIVIEDYTHQHRDIQLKMLSSLASTTIFSRKDFLLIIVFIAIDFIRR